VDDLAIAAPTFAGGGRVYLFPGGIEPLLDAEDAVMTVEGDEPYFGVSLAGLDDVSGDALPELVIGSPQEGSYGRFFLFSGLTEGSVFQGDAWSTFAGINTDQDVGWGLASPGDLDGDGAPDLLAFGGHWLEGGLHAAAWVWSPTEGFSDTRDATVRLIGGLRASPPQFEISAAAVGDLDDDGIGALALAWPGLDTGTVAVWDVGVFDGGDRGIDDAEALVTGLELGAGGVSPKVAGVGDQDGDGYDDLVITEPARDTATGAFHILLGGPGR
jgi:hypothetical protein